jgi:hypothetical protein
VHDASPMLAAYAEHPATMNGHAMIGHDPSCRFIRGGSCDCTPDVTLRLPDGSLVEVGHDGGVKRETRQ